MRADIAGAAGVLFFGFVGLSMAAELIRNDPVLILSRLSLLDRRFGPEPIPWIEIDEVVVHRLEGQLMVGLKVAAPQRYLRPQTSALAWISRFNPALGYESLTLPLGVLKESPEAVAGALNRYWQAARSNT